MDETSEAIAASVAKKLAADQEFVKGLAEAIAAAQKKQVMDQIYKDFGKGVLGFIIHGLGMGLIAVAAWGAAHEWGIIKWH